MKNQTQEILGQYASDHALMAGNPALDYDAHGTKDARGDGNAAFHQENVFGQTDTDPDAIEDLLGYGEGYGIRSEAEIFGNGVKRARSSKKDLADDWMKKNGHKWD